MAACPGLGWKRLIACLPHTGRLDLGQSQVEFACVIWCDSNRVENILLDHCHLVELCCCTAATHLIVIETGAVSSALTDLQQVATKFSFPLSLNYTLCYYEAKLQVYFWESPSKNPATLVTGFMIQLNVWF
jgi:hypothetical protein